MRNDFYVYRHIRLDKNTPFYAGKGRLRRAFASGIKRSNLWNYISKKHGHDTEIFIENLTEEDALKKEAEFIKMYKSLGYCEANFTDGGTGSFGFTHKEESKYKIGSFNRGKKLSEKTRKKMSQSAKKGKDHYLFGKMAKTRKAVLCSNGNQYQSITEAARILGISRQDISAVVNKRQKSCRGLFFIILQKEKLNG